MMRVCVVAEIGVNHNGSFVEARDMIDAAKEAGADAVKFQVFDAELLEPPGRNRDIIRKLQLDGSDLEALKAHADTVGIEFLATPFDPGSLTRLVELGVERIKIGSADLSNASLLDVAASSGLDLILSTGMSRINDIFAALRAMNWPKNVTLLHCTSCYPAPFESVNLKAMTTIADKFGLPVGYSDHTIGIDVSLAAVALGAVMIEKHMTMHPTQEGPDHQASILPEDFADLVVGVRAIELALGSPVKAPQGCEVPVMGVRHRRETWRNAT